MEIVFAFIALAFITGAVCGALFTYLVLQCCHTSKPVPSHFSEQHYESGSANTDKDFYRYLSTGYKENWIYIVSDERRVYHVKTDCRTTNRTNPSSFRWYRLCKVCGYTLHCDTTTKSQAAKKLE